MRQLTRRITSNQCYSATRFYNSLATLPIEHFVPEETDQRNIPKARISKVVRINCIMLHTKSKPDGDNCRAKKLGIDHSYRAGDRNPIPRAPPTRDRSRRLTCNRSLLEAVQLAAMLGTLTATPQSGPRRLGGRAAPSNPSCDSTKQSCPAS